MKSKKTLILLGALLASLISGNALANDGTPPWIHELVQSDDTNITITIGIVDSGEPGLSSSYTVERDGPEGVETVIEETSFVAADADETEERCRGGMDMTAQCEKDPTYCVDCDGDKILECNTYDYGWCETVYYFDVVDWCVPAGETDYSFFEADFQYVIDQETIEVEPWDGECEPPATDTDTDTDSDIDSDSDSDTDSDSDSDGDDAEGNSDDGCTVSGVGSSTSSWLASILSLIFS